MFKPEVRSLLNAPLVARLSVIDRGGYPHTVPLWFDVDGDDIVMISDRNTRKVAFLAANPNDVDVLTGLVCLCQQAGDGAAARRYLAQLRELDPGNPAWDPMHQQLDAPAAN